MDCQKCCQNNFSAFKEATCVFENRRDLSPFLLNVVLNLKENGKLYCFCHHTSECEVCQIRKIFFDDEYDIYKNIFDLNFVAQFHANLHACLEELFNTKKHIVCNLIFVEYRYFHVDWYMVKKNVFLLSKVIDLYHNNGYRVVL